MVRAQAALVQRSKPLALHLQCLELLLCAPACFRRVTLLPVTALQMPAQTCILIKMVVNLGQRSACQQHAIQCHHLALSRQRNIFDFDQSTQYMPVRVGKQVNQAHVKIACERERTCASTPIQAYVSAHQFRRALCAAVPARAALLHTPVTFAAPFAALAQLAWCASPCSSAYKLCALKDRPAIFISHPTPHASDAPLKTICYHHKDSRCLRSACTTDHCHMKRSSVAPWTSRCLHRCDRRHTTLLTN